jgi:hypothetical protein
VKMRNPSGLIRIITTVFVFSTLLAVTAGAAFADSCETVDANAMGTSTQMGKIIPVKFRFCRPATPEDRQTLIEAFKKGQNQGLANALQKMPSAGRISLPSTTGYDLAYVRIIPTSTGRIIRFITNRRISFGEVYYSTRSSDYSLTAGQLVLNDKDKSKNTGVLYPATQIRLSKKGELTFELYKNPWKLQNIIDWGNKEGE